MVQSPSKSAFDTGSFTTSIVMAPLQQHPCSPRNPARWSSAIRGLPLAFKIGPLFRQPLERIFVPAPATNP
jgi:hypothetical protein